MDTFNDEVKLPGIQKKAVQRVGCHSHIKGLGLNEELEPAYMKQGMVGQLDARMSAGILVSMIKKGKMAGRIFLFAGPSGTGKSALAVGLGKSLGSDVPFIHMSATEIFSLAMSKTEALKQALRKSMYIQMREEMEVIEGQVLDLEVNRQLGDTSSKTGTIKMRTTDIEVEYELGSNIVDVMVQEEVRCGEVISINTQMGTVTKLGQTVLDESGNLIRYVSIPEGELLKMTEVTHMFSLHDIDCINSRAYGFMSIFNGDTGEINPEIRTQIDVKVSEWEDEGKATIIQGVLFLDDAHMLDMECFSFLNTALENELAPIVLLAGESGVRKIRGTELESSHGIPIEFLDRVLIVPTYRYSKHELRDILRIKCEEERVNIDEAAVAELTTISSKMGLQYSFQIISSASCLAERRNSRQVTVEDLKKVYELFSDTKRSAQYLRETEEDYMFNKKRVKISVEEPEDNETVFTEICDMNVLTKKLKKTSN